MKRNLVFTTYHSPHTTYTLQPNFIVFGLYKFFTFLTLEFGWDFFGNSIHLFIIICAAHFALESIIGIHYIGKKICTVILFLVVKKKEGEEIRIVDHCNAKTAVGYAA